MKSKFESYLRSQRENMDVENPDDQLIWDGISRELQPRKTAWAKHFWKIAASIILLASLGYVFHNEFYRQRPQNIYNITLSEIEPRYADEVSGYRAAFQQKWQKVNDLNPGNMEKLDFFFEELNGLDAMYKNYQEDFHNYGYNEELIRAMLDYYEKRVKILDRMLMEIQKHNNYEKRKEAHTEI